jgi:hypothetical protein
VNPVSFNLFNFTAVDFLPLVAGSPARLYASGAYGVLLPAMRVAIRRLAHFPICFRGKRDFLKPTRRSCGVTFRENFRMTGPPRSRLSCGFIRWQPK